MAQVGNQDAGILVVLFAKPNHVPSELPPPWNDPLPVCCRPIFLRCPLRNSKGGEDERTLIDNREVPVALVSGRFSDNFALPSWAERGDPELCRDGCSLAIWLAHWRFAWLDGSLIVVGLLLAEGSYR